MILGGIIELGLAVVFGVLMLGLALIGLIFATVSIYSPKYRTYRIDEMPVPGRKCPTCLSKGQTIWVIPGKSCPQCGTPVN